jgi:hypothetical protein
MNPEHFDRRSADPSISPATCSPIFNPLEKALLSPGLSIHIPGNATPYPSDREPPSPPKRLWHFRASACSYMAYQRSRIDLIDPLISQLFFAIAPILSSKATLLDYYLAWRTVETILSMQESKCRSMSCCHKRITVHPISRSFR